MKVDSLLHICIHSCREYTTGARKINCLGCHFTGDHGDAKALGHPSCLCPGHLSDVQLTRSSFQVSLNAELQNIFSCLYFELISE